jgi:DNA-binding winged helix-turn-helix (wHTH) protein/pimeloyl-ACP methyl ester carboxylesterase
MDRLGAGQMIYTFDDCKLDTAGYELQRGGVPVAIEPQVFELLCLLLSRQGQVITRDEIIDVVWKGRIVSDTTLSSRIKAARQSIGDDGTAQRLIKTIHGRGFRFDGDVIQGEVLPDRPPRAAPDAPQVRQTIKYCRADDGVLLAYGESGQGSPLVKAANWLSHLEYEWQSPVWGHWWRELSKHNRLIRYDERGMGLSDWNVEDLSFSAFVRDLEAIVDSMKLDRFALLGLSQGAPTCIEYAVRHPERVSCMVLYGGYAAGWLVRNDPQEVARRMAMVHLTRSGWGQNNPAFRQIFTSLFIPEATTEETQWLNDLCRISTSPENAARLQLSCAEIDVTDRLREVSVPTLVIHNRDEAVVPLAAGRLLATSIPNARFVVTEGSNHIILEKDACWPRFLAEVQEFINEHDGQNR